MIEIIPAIDIIEGKCVRLTQGDYSLKTTYDEDPLEIAKRFEGAGIKRLHIVDLDGARSNHIKNAGVAERIASHTTLEIDFGGGIKSDDDIRKAFDSGAGMVTIGSIAIKNPELFQAWLETYGCEKIILGADVRNGRISINGWKEDGGEELEDFVKRQTQSGIRKILCTDISRDGMLEGPNTLLYKRTMERHPDIHLIASGGISCIEDIEELNNAGIPAVVFGKAIYEGRIKLTELEKFIC